MPKVAEVMPVGVPLMMPVTVLMVSPAGRAPLLSM